MFKKPKFLLDSFYILVSLFAPRKRRWWEWTLNRITYVCYFIVVFNIYNITSLYIGKWTHWTDGREFWKTRKRYRIIICELAFLKSLVMSRVMTDADICHIIIIYRRKLTGFRWFGPGGSQRDILLVNGHFLQSIILYDLHIVDILYGENKLGNIFQKTKLSCWKLQINPAHSQWRRRSLLVCKHSMVHYW